MGRWGLGPGGEGGTGGTVEDPGEEAEPREVDSRGWDRGEKKGAGKARRVQGGGGWAGDKGLQRDGDGGRVNERGGAKKGDGPK